MSLSLANTGFELKSQVGAWRSSTLYMTGLAVLSIGAAETEDEAHRLVWDAITAVDQHEPARNALAFAGVDVAAVEGTLRLIKSASDAGRRDAEVLAFRQAVKAEERLTGSRSVNRRPVMVRDELRA